MKKNMQSIFVSEWWVSLGWLFFVLCGLWWLLSWWIHETSTHRSVSNSSWVQKSQWLWIWNLRHVVQMRGWIQAHSLTLLIRWTMISSYRATTQSSVEVTWILVVLEMHAFSHTTLLIQIWLQICWIISECLWTVGYIIIESILNRLNLRDIIIATIDWWF